MDYGVGDTVYCLAWVGTAFTVVDTDAASGRVSIEAPTARDPKGIQIDLFPDMMFMLTHQPWDQIWHWPDRAGERYETVYERFVDQHPAGTVFPGYALPGLMTDLTKLLYLAPDTTQAMTFRALGPRPFGGGFAVEAVVAVDDAGRPLADADPANHGSWVAAGPAVGARLGMRGYRWALSYGEFVLNWHDLVDRIKGHEDFFIPLPTSVTKDLSGRHE